jgi:DUF4097 and DUF4098 domain-containing protein YvlB
MKKSFVCGTLLSFAMLATAAGTARGQSISIRTDNDVPITNCDQLRISFDHHGVSRDEQDFTIPKSQAPRLEARPSEHGGVRVQGWDRDEYQVKACKAAKDNADLGRISVSVSGGRVEVKGPSRDESWVVYLLIQAPRDAALNLETKNGEIGLRDLNGKIDARTLNGPIEVKQCAGDIHAQAKNGPIDFDGSHGNLHLESENGPLSIELTGNRWEGGELEGRTENGPLSVHVPRDFASGIEVEASGSSPFDCQAKACTDAHGNWGRDHRGVTLGTGAAVIRLSSVNGPVSIEDKPRLNDPI